MGIQERKARERKRRRQQIMVAAKRVFSNHGFSKATMEDIANEAELSPGTLYLYFKNKDELYASLTLRVLQYMNIRLKQVEEESYENTESMLDALKQALMDVYEFDPMFLINMLHLQSSEALHSLSADLLKDIQALSHKSLQNIAAIFQRGIEADMFVHQSPLVLADMMWALFTGVILLEETQKIVHNRKARFKESLETAFEIFNRGVTQPA
jgi:AcrR family transcriptional regulator